MPKKLTGTVLQSYYKKSLVQVKNHYYILRKDLQPGSTVEFMDEDGLEMPSFMFAMAAMNEENLEDTFDFIKANWFNDFNI